MDPMQSSTWLTCLYAAIAVLTVAVILLAVLGARRTKRTRRLSASDTITGGLYTVGFCRAAQKQLEQDAAGYAVVVMEVKDMPQVRRSFGDAAGDQLLMYVQNTLRHNLSNVEPFGRMSGGTFCLLLKNNYAEGVRARLDRICDSINSFNQKRATPYPLSIVFGICLPGTAVRTAEQRLESAGEALSLGEGQFRFSEDAEPGSGWTIVEETERSLHSGDFLVFMQPKVRLGDDRVSGAEALVRWRHPRRGMLTPEMFVAPLEEHHMMSQVDRYLFETVCRKMAEWKRSGCVSCPVSVNLSKNDLELPDFARECARVCRRYDIEPALIEFELSEDFYQGDPKQLHSLIGELHACGFQCSLSNFGKNSIPLHLLREAEVDAVKLDRSFFFSENNSQRSRYIIEAILKLANQMHIRTVAEGIDNASQVQYLQQAACDAVQGFCYFRPMPIDEFRREMFVDGELRFVEQKGERSEETARDGESNIVMFSLLAGEDRIFFSHAFSPLLRGQTELTGAMDLFQRSGLIHENDLRDFVHLVDRCRKEEGWVSNTLRFYTTQGRYEWLEVHMHCEDPMAVGDVVISGTLVNMAGWKNEVDRWKEKATRDALTGLYNREYFEQTVASLLKKGGLTSGALVFMDVDDFKQVNDTLGHMVGDDVLCWVAKRLLGAFRHTDIVARYAGDEFVVFANGISQADLEKRLTQLGQAFRFPYRNGDIEYPVSGSMGGAMYPENGTEYTELLHNADTACYASKGRGKNQYAIYGPGIEETAERYAQVRKEKEGH